MKASFVSLICLVALTLTGVAMAGAGPVSPLYLTNTGVGGGSSNIVVVQGNTISMFATAYGAYEFPIAVYGDVRTIGDALTGSRFTGGQYTLAGVPTGTSYTAPTGFGQWSGDSTSDGTYNYLVNANNVYRTNRDFSNPVMLFHPSKLPFGITYDRSTNSLWVEVGGKGEIANYSMTGTLLSSFSGTGILRGIAWDPADGTLWGVNNTTHDLVQYSTAGVLLSTGPNVGGDLGAEFNLSPTTPEPGTLVLLGSGVLGLAGMVRRKVGW